MPVLVVGGGLDYVKKQVEQEVEYKASVAYNNTTYEVKNCVSSQSDTKNINVRCMNFCIIKVLQNAFQKEKRYFKVTEALQYHDLF